MPVFGLALLALLGYGAFFLHWDPATFVVATIMAAVVLVGGCRLVYGSW